METSNKNHISYQEMDELIGLAEKVSVNVETLKGKIKKNKTSLILLCLLINVTMTASLTLINFNSKTVLIGNPSLKFLLILSLMTISIVPFFFTVQEMSKLKNVVEREKQVLQKLLNMIEGYKDLYVEDEYGNNQSVVSKALFEMRLNRINFEVK